MTAEAITLRGRHEQRKTAAAAIAAGEIQQMPDGRAGVRTGLDAASSGDRVNFVTEGQFTVTKAASQVWLDGAPIWWDHSANAATCVPPLVTGDRDFFLGTAVGDVASATTSGVVNLNVEPRYEWDCNRDGGDTVIVKTVVGSTTVEVPNLIARGGSIYANFGTTAEAQKVDLLGKRSFPLGSNWILEAVVDVVTNCDADVGDLNIGMANGTHASDADAITESVFFHLDMGADLNIDAESDDGTTEVAATDTTLDWAVGTPVHLVLDGRDPSDVKFYVNGVEVLNAEANLGNIAAATGPLFPLFHLEKSSNDSPGTVSLDMLRVRIQE